MEMAKAEILTMDTTLAFIGERERGREYSNSENLKEISNERKAKCYSSQSGKSNAKAMGGGIGQVLGRPELRGFRAEVNQIPD